MLVLMVVKSGVTDDARIRRIASAVSAVGHSVIVIGDRPGPDHPIPGVEIVYARPPRSRRSVLTSNRVRRFVRWFGLPTHRRRDDLAFATAVRAVAIPYRPDLVHAHDLSGLRAAQPFLADDATLVYDAHECWTGRKMAGRPSPIGRWFDSRAERRLGTAAAAVITVSEPLAEWLRTNRDFADVRVVRNTFPATDEDAVLRPDRVLYAGLIDEKRDLRTVVDGVDSVEGVELEIRGAGDPNTIEWLAQCGHFAQKPVAVDELTLAYQRAGIGVVALNDDSINHRVALPNKLFQSVQAGVPVVASSLPAIRAIVEEYGLGECFEPGNAMSFAAALRAVVAEYDRFVAAVGEARPQLSWDFDREILLKLYAELENA